MRDNYFLVRYLDEDGEFICARETYNIYETLLIIKYAKDNGVEVELSTEENEDVSGLVKEIIIHTGDDTSITRLDVYMDI